MKTREQWRNKKVFSPFHHDSIVSPGDGMIWDMMGLFENIGKKGTIQWFTHRILDNSIVIEAFFGDGSITIRFCEEVWGRISRENPWCYFVWPPPWLSFVSGVLTDINPDFYIWLSLAFYLILWDHKRGNLSIAFYLAFSLTNILTFLLALYLTFSLTSYLTLYPAFSQA